MKDTHQGVGGHGVLRFTRNDDERFHTCIFRYMCMDRWVMMLLYACPLSMISFWNSRLWTMLVSRRLWVEMRCCGLEMYISMKQRRSCTVYIYVHVYICTYIPLLNIACVFFLVGLSRLPCGKSVRSNRLY